MYRNDSCIWIAAALYVHTLICSNKLHIASRELKHIHNNTITKSRRVVSHRHPIEFWLYFISNQSREYIVCYIYILIFTLHKWITRLLTYLRKLIWFKALGLEWTLFLSPNGVGKRQLKGYWKSFSLSVDGY